MSYYHPNFQMYSYPTYDGHYNLYSPDGSDLSRTVQLARSALMNHPNMNKGTESKPRLAKEEVEQLESEFQKNNKPNSSLKKTLAEQMRVDIARINVLNRVCRTSKSIIANASAELVSEQTGQSEARGEAEAREGQLGADVARSGFSQGVLPVQ